MTNRTYTTKPKLLFHVQHLLGIGHQMRAAALTRAFLKAGFEVHYVSGGFPEKLPDLGDAKFYQLPPVKTDNGDFNRLINAEGKLIDAQWWEMRRNQVQMLYTLIKPDLLLLEGFPFARRKFAEELIPLLQRAKQDGIPCATSVRDILVNPAKEKKRLFAFETSEIYLDKILVHGEEGFCPLRRSFEGAERIEDKLFYTGYVDSGSKLDKEANQASEVIVSAGGGAAGSDLYLSAIKARKHSQQAKGLWRILIGPNLFADIKSKLLSEAAEQPDILIEEARPDFRALLSKTQLSISQCGYNTVMDILASGVNSLVVPFAKGGETEQALRAELLQEKDRLQVLAEADLSPETLAKKIDEMLVKSGEASHNPFTLNGAEKSAAALMDLLKTKN